MAKTKSRRVFYFVLIIIAWELILFIRPTLVENGVLNNTSILKVISSYKDFFLVYLYLFFGFIFVAAIHYEYYKKDERIYSFKKIIDMFKYELKEMGFNKFRPRFTKRFILFMVITIIYILLRIGSFEKSAFYRSHILRLLIFMVPLTLSEEIFARYGLFKVLRQSKINPFLAYVIPAILFASVHYYYNGFYPPVFSAIYSFSTALFYQFAYESTGWSIYTIWFLHLIQDIL